MSSESKVIIVTGASRGIGLAITRYLLNKSHKVVLVARSTEALSALKNEYPSQVEYVAGDLTVADTPWKVVEKAVLAFGKLDAVVINHGILSPMTRIENSSVDEWKNLFDANFFSALALVKEVIPHLRATNGRIIFTSSGAAVGAYAAWGPYGSSKAAMNSLARHIAVEEPDITAVAIGPGRVDTDMQKEIREQGSASMSAKDYAGFVSAFEEGKLNKPEWPGQVMAKLALDAKPELSGKYLNWNAPELAEFQEEQ